MNVRIPTPDCLFELRDALSRAKVSSRVDVISKAKVPILKYVDSVTRFPVDVSINMANGLEAAAVVRGFVEDAVTGQATRTLMLLLKQFLVQRHLNEVFSGGLGSYSLLCMIVSFLKVFRLIDR